MALQARSRAFLLLAPPPFVYDLLAIALIVAALVVGVRNTRDINAVSDADHFRDIAQAQTVRDGHPLTDPYYRGEWAWYNPLLAWTLAIGSSLQGTSVERFQVHAGPWLNLLGPIAFYLLAVKLGGRRAALAALALYLFFITGNEHSWAAATYSPWLFVANFAQGLFYLSALLMVRTHDRPTLGRALATGVLMGVTFLAHTAPALILAVVACLWFAGRPRTLVTMGLSAFVVASPFLLPLALTYRFHVVHAMPVAYVSPPLSPAGMPGTLVRYAPLLAAACIGLWRMRSRLPGLWLATSIGLLLYTLAPTPPLLPGYHFWLYTTALLAILAGAAAAWACPSPVVFLVATLALVAWQWPTYTDRADFRVLRFFSEKRNPDHLAAAQFLRQITRPDDVVVGTYGVVRLIVGPAGRKTIAPDPNFANPYRPFEPREADRDRMLTAIAAGDGETLRQLARKYTASAVVSAGPEDCANLTRLLPVSWRFGEVCISMLD